MEDKKLVSRFVVLTFCIAYTVSGALIVLGRLGYQVYGWVQTPAQWAANLPFALYILSPAIASYGTLRRSGRAVSFPQWLGAVFHVEKKGAPYLFVAAGLVVYFAIHGTAFGQVRLSLPLSAFFLSLPGNLIIGGMEEAGWQGAGAPEARDASEETAEAGVGATHGCAAGAGEMGTAGAPEASCEVRLSGSGRREAGNTSGVNSSG